MTAYKLFTQRKDGSLGPLFINRSQRIPIGEWLPAESHPTKGYALRPGWHCVAEPIAPHLSTKGRVWAKVSALGTRISPRPKCQGGVWILADKIKVLKTLEHSRQQP